MPEIPIASLSRAALSPDVSIRGVVTLVWPYSASSQTFAVQLATEDFRLRRQHGQVRITFRGPAAESVASVAGIADKLVLSLDGAEFVDTQREGVHGELVFTRRLRVCIEHTEGPETVIEIDEPEWQPVQEEILATLTRTISALSQSVSYGNLRAPLYRSPVVQRAVQSSPIVADPFLDDDLDADVPRKRPRISFGEVKSWHFAEKSPSPEPAEELTGEVSTSEQLSELPTIAQTAMSQSSQPMTAAPTSMQPPLLPLLRVPVVAVEPTTPRLEPVSATTLPLPSPFPNEAMQSHFPPAVPAISSTSPAVGPIEKVLDEQPSSLGTTSRPDNAGIASAATGSADHATHVISESPMVNTSMKQTLSSLFGFQPGATAEQPPRTPTRPQISAFDIAASPSIDIQPEDGAASKEQSISIPQSRTPESQTVSSPPNVVPESPSSVHPEMSSSRQGELQSQEQPFRETSQKSRRRRTATQEDEDEDEVERQARAELVLDISERSSSPSQNDDSQEMASSPAQKSLQETTTRASEVQSDPQHLNESTNLAMEASMHQLIPPNLPTREQMAARQRKRRSEVPVGMLKWSAPRTSLDAEHSADAVIASRLWIGRDHAMALPVPAAVEARPFESDRTQQADEQHIASALAMQDAKLNRDQPPMTTEAVIGNGNAMPDAKPVIKSPRTPIRLLVKPEVAVNLPSTSPGFRTAYSYFTRLSALNHFINITSQAHHANEIDVLAVIASESTPIKRQQKQPREYYTVFEIMDRSLATSPAVQVELYCPRRYNLPVASPGDVILLRAVTVRSRDKQPYIKTTGGSTWSVFSLASDMQQGELHRLPVEYGKEELQEALELQSWYMSLAPTVGEPQSQSSTPLEASPVAMAVK